MPDGVLVDPQVSRAKFDAEVDQFRALQDEHHRRGWWLMRAAYPEVFVIFATPRLRPTVAVFGALLDFTNYDLWAPSVRIVDPFTQAPYKGKELPTALLRRTPAPAPPADGIGPADPAGNTIEVQPLMQAHAPDDIPFLCLPGVREYHSHPAHTGDSWLLHRGTGEGTLYFLLDALYRYGVAPISGFQMNVQLRAPALVLHQEDVPA